MKISPQVAALLPLKRSSHRQIVTSTDGLAAQVFSGAVGIIPASELEALMVTAVNSHEALVAALTECLANTGGGWIAASVVDRARAALALAGAV